MATTKKQRKVKQTPRAASDVRDLPATVTFFMTGRERQRLLRRLRRVDGDRTRALLMELGLEDG